MLFVWFSKGVLNNKHKQLTVPLERFLKFIPGTVVLYAVAEIGAKFRIFCS